MILNFTSDTVQLVTLTGDSVSIRQVCGPMPLHIRSRALKNDSRHGGIINASALNHHWMGDQTSKLNLYYDMHNIPKLKRSSSVAVIFAQSLKPGVKLRMKM